MYPSVIPWRSLLGVDLLEQFSVWHIILKQLLRRLDQAPLHCQVLPLPQILLLFHLSSKEKLSALIYHLSAVRSPKIEVSQSCVPSRDFRFLFVCLRACWVVFRALTCLLHALSSHHTVLPDSSACFWYMPCLSPPRQSNTISSPHKPQPHLLSREAAPYGS